MKKDIAMEWVKALRSGRFKQGDGYLRNETERGFDYCCLGVLCEITKSNTGGQWNDSMFEVSGNIGIGVLPSNVLAQFGMKTCDGATGQNTTLATKNDDGWSFLEIADFIEKNYKKL